MKAKEQKQKEVDELVARDLECKEAAETVKKLELELKEKEAKEKEQKEIEKELKKKEAVEAERDALQTNLADLNKTKDHLLKTIETLKSEQKSVQDEIKLSDAPLEKQVVETKAERADARKIDVKKEDPNLLTEPIQVEGDLATDLLGEELAPVEPNVAVVADLFVDAPLAPIDVDNTKAFERNDEETTEESETNSQAGYACVIA